MVQLATGGQSWESQADEADARLIELKHDEYLGALHREIRNEAFLLAVNPTVAGITQALYRALRKGVSEAESGMHATWILETEPK